MDDYNKEYVDKFQRLIEIERQRGRDHFVLNDYLLARNSELEKMGIDFNNLSEYLKENKDNLKLYDKIFSNFEKRVIGRMTRLR